MEKDNGKCESYHLRSNRFQENPVELPGDVPMRRLIPALVTKMGLPTQQGANPITYRLDHRDSGKRLSEDETLSQAGVKEDDILSLFLK